MDKHNINKDTGPLLGRAQPYEKPTPETLFYNLHNNSNVGSKYGNVVEHCKLWYNKNFKCDNPGCEISKGTAEALRGGHLI